MRGQGIEERQRSARLACGRALATHVVGVLFALANRRPVRTVLRVVLAACKKTDSLSCCKIEEN